MPRLFLRRVGFPYFGLLLYSLRGATVLKVKLRDGQWLLIEQLLL